MEIRRRIESGVVSVNKILRSTVRKMDLIILLRNCHPADSINFARELFNDGQLTKDEASEFTKFIGYGSH